MKKFDLLLVFGRERHNCDGNLHKVKFVICFLCLSS